MANRVPLTPWMLDNVLQFHRHAQEMHFSRQLPNTFPVLFLFFYLQYTGNTFRPSHIQK